MSDPNCSSPSPSPISPVNRRATCWSGWCCGEASLCRRGSPTLLRSRRSSPWCEQIDRARGTPSW